MLVQQWPRGECLKIIARLSEIGQIPTQMDAMQWDGCGAAAYALDAITDDARITHMRRKYEAASLWRVCHFNASVFGWWSESRGFAPCHQHHVTLTCRC
jgi:hypothetical protein